MNLKLLEKIKSFNEMRLKKLKGPKELPQQLGGYLVVQKSMDPDLVWGLRCLMKPREKKGQYLFRVFSPNMANNKGIRIVDYHTLDKYPEIILYHGWFDKYSNQVVFENKIDKPAA